MNNSTYSTWESMKFRSPNGETLRLVMRPTENDVAEDASHWFMFEDNVDREVFYTMSEVELITELN